MGMRRFTRLTSAFSKKVENFAYAGVEEIVHPHLVAANFGDRRFPIDRPLPVL